jgi:hypothetical protein
METAEPSDWRDSPYCLRRSVEQNILVKRKVRAHPVVGLDDRTPTLSEGLAMLRQSMPGTRG